MAAVASAELIAEAELAAKSCAPEQRLRMLRQLTELFAAGAARFEPLQIRVFDDVLLPLIERSDARTLAKVSGIFAALHPAPTEAVRRLARHQDDTVAAPILARSTVLSDEDLVQIAGSCSQRHLLAMAGRPRVNERLTDLILKRAGKETARLLARNPGARFSEKGHSALLALAQHDDGLAESLGLRPDLPEPARRELLSRASETVRARLLKAAPAELREKIRSILDALAPAQPGLPVDYSEPLAMVDALNRIGKLNDSTMNRFAVRREFANLVAGLSVLSGGSVKVIEPLMGTSDCEGLIIACRAARLNWQTTLSVINSRPAPKLSSELLEMSRQLFDMLSLSSAQYTIRFEPPIPASAKAAKEAAGER